MHGKTPIILGKSDFRILKRYMADLSENESLSSRLLSWELRSAIVVEDDLLPENCVRLNSTIKIREWPSNSVREFSIVHPECVDPKKKMISFLDPWGAAFIGLSKTEKVEREINGNSKCFEIMDVRPLKTQVN
ncbi:GreA/GreB family elongation factor [Dyadobacter sp. CY347]|uniref:GreA/GreB family elongation factor n=1 Tax=Dyadobacter sp. CY347 TaxID=2909336 RepID=UPI001F285D71|nr:GreA/GreB family elongation factor [Dyadobacter sp. CY347]MCF2487735.1 GreA/GreB family elongation factor [Dyadobacter sp. CY347]